MGIYTGIVIRLPELLLWKLSNWKHTEIFYEVARLVHKYIKLLKLFDLAYKLYLFSANKYLKIFFNRVHKKDAVVNDLIDLL